MNSGLQTREVTARLRAAGLRPTRQRIALARLLFGEGDRHVTAEQLHAEALGADTRVSLATVYNTLHQLVDAGLLREVTAESGRSWFDTNTGTHHHFYHADDGELWDVPTTGVAIGALPAAPAGTVIERVDVVIRLRRNGAAN